MKNEIRDPHQLEIMLCWGASILFISIMIVCMCSCSTTQVIIHQEELPENCYNSGVKDSNKVCLNTKIPNVFKIELDSISEVIIDPKDGSKIAEVWYSNAKQGIKDLCLHCNQTQAKCLIGFMKSNPLAEEWVGVNYKPTEKEPYCDIRRTYGSSINAY